MQSLSQDGRLDLYAHVAEGFFAGADFLAGAAGLPVPVVSALAGLTALVVDRARREWAQVLDTPLGVPAPLEAELLYLLARRLPLFCGDPVFKGQLDGWRPFQADLLDGALYLDWFLTPAVRVEAEAYLKELTARPLCGG